MCVFEIFLHEKSTLMIVFLVCVLQKLKWSLNNLNSQGDNALHVTGVLFPASSFFFFFFHFKDLLLFSKFYFLDSITFGKDSSLTYLMLIKKIFKHHSLNSSSLICQRNELTGKAGGTS